MIFNFAFWISQIYPAGNKPTIHDSGNVSSGDKQIKPNSFH